MLQGAYLYSERETAALLLTLFTLWGKKKTLHKKKCTNEGSVVH